MKFIADLHIHSKYSRATSPSMVLEELDRWADDKGILVMGTGDFTHPEWFKEIKKKLSPAERGLFKLKKQYKRKTLKGTFSETRFFLTAEISSIFSRKDSSTKSGKKTYRIHNLVFVPDIKTVEKINAKLGLIGNLKSDGRPILGLDSKEFAKIIFNINSEAVIVPAHIWTPWFSLFGSMSGFDSLEECFGNYAKNIFAVETGLSSDPSMNWRLSKLDSVALISNSDSHSLQKIGREANIFDTELSYAGIIAAIKSSASSSRKSAFIATIEFFPEEGKYHFDGHRLCGIVFSPEETKKHKDICPKCGKKLTIGVMNRVVQLADRKNIKTLANGNYHLYENRVPYYNLIALDKIIAEAYRVGIASKKVKEEYKKMIKNFGSELKILMDIPIEQFSAEGGSASGGKNSVDSRIIESIKIMRSGKVKIRPGFDGEYGKVNTS
ncbi:MAG: endonuclease Q family protein [Patescibacteria group bacterium]